ncbi:MAG TPA: hypothetical protein VEV17_17810 [Bryobacteraceae bacterium]|nr:hypothetical protein [Bryobacteraceae bacterium]
MKARLLAWIGILALVMAVVVALSVPAAAQVTAAAAKTTTVSPKNWTPPRTADGHPDLQGVWNNSTMTPLERPRDLGDKASFTVQERDERERKMLADLSTDRRDGPPEVDVNRSYNELWRERGHLLLRTSLIIDPPDGRLPALTPEGQKQAKARAEDRRRRGPDATDSWEDRNLAERCITRGAPKLPGGYNNNFQIIQAAKYVVITQEMIHETRIIPLDGRPHVDKNIRLWMGDSRGHWEGNTLVVETTNYNDKIVSESFNCCPGTGSGLHVVERFTRVGPDRIDYQYTVDDPNIYTRPWTASVPMTRSDEPMYEYACHEGNYAMVDMLAGARAKEKEAAKKK